MRAAAAIAILWTAALAPAAVGQTPPAVGTPGTPETPAAESVEALIASADAHYARRAEGHRGALAEKAEIGEAIAGYALAATRDPGGAAARWRLARALYFQASYTGLDEKGQRDVFARGKTAGEEALAILRRRSAAGSVSGSPAANQSDSLAPATLAGLLRGDPDAAPALFWSAVDWGQWGLVTGKMEAARQGVAHRVRDYCLALIELDPGFEEGGAYRILGRLHDRAPRIPFVTGWVSREEGIRYLRLAVSAAPDNLVNLQFLAEALARGSGRTEARRLEESVLTATPKADHLVEELSIQESARANLALWRSAGGGPHAETPAASRSGSAPSLP